MVAQADGRVGERIGNYTKFWQSDLKQETNVEVENRLGDYTNVVNGEKFFYPNIRVTNSRIRSGYYDGATDLYEYGWAKSFHFSRFYKGESFYASLARHEHFLAARMNIRPGMRVLDVGCGVGGPAREIARFTDATLVGVNNNVFQVRRAREYTKKAGLDKQITFVTGDFLKLAEQFGENSFDAGESTVMPCLLCNSPPTSLCHRGYLSRAYLGERLR